ncbi:MAG: DNA adenine methylase [Candidatus Peribacteraceae bacterium]|nr:DNA adenine methylase [Candidatus Peribacteraceae bacterium]
MDSRVITLTKAAHKYGNINIRACGKDFFPKDAFGGSSRDKGLGIPITIKAKGLNEPIKTDIPTDRITGKPRWIFRERRWVKHFVSTNHLTSGTIIKIVRLSKRIYQISPTNGQNRYAINSPFRYAGGKFYARKLILEHIPEHDYYCEPFAGGASIFFAKEKSTKSHLNDLDKDLIRVLKFIKNKPEELINFIKEMPASKELHHYYKNEFKPKTQIEKAGRWYYLNRTSYSGIMNMQNCYWGYGDKYSMQPQNWPTSIRRCSEKLKNVKLTSFDFEKVINTLPDGALVFVDPPYYNADQDKFYTCAFLKEEHFRLVLCKN